VIITGPPEAGKTTIMQKVVELLDTLKGDVCYTGFEAVEIRYGVVRQGFRIIPKGDAIDAVAPWTLSHMNYTDSPYTVGKYGVDVATYDKNIPFCFQFKDSSSNLLPVIVIDEIGMMECYSDVFRREVEKALDDPDLIVIATCGQRGNRFMERIRQREDVRLIVLKNVADAIREDIPQQIYSNIVDLLEGDIEEGEEKETETKGETGTTGTTGTTTGTTGTAETTAKTAKTAKTETESSTEKGSDTSGSGMMGSVMMGSVSGMTSAGM
jgi:nucleoside-triphosphatase THEP1